jgi:hypothetical protein
MALIEEVGVVQLQAVGKPQGHNSYLYIELCNDPYLPGFPHRYEAMPPEKDDELTELQKPQTPQIDRAFASFRRRIALQDPATFTAVLHSSSSPTVVTL